MMGKLLGAAAAAANAAQMREKSSLVHLPHIRLHKLRIQPYLKDAHHAGLGTLLKMRCRTGSLEVNALLRTRTIADCCACPFCGEEESVAHFILHCPAYDELRAAMFARLQPLLGGESAYRRFRDADDTLLAANILSDRFWSGGHLPEANAAVCNFLAEAWHCRVQNSGAFA